MSWLYRFDGLHADRPPAAEVPGGLYACGDHGTIDRSDGTTWTTWASVDDQAALESLAANRRAIHTAASKAFANNQTFLALTVPTNAQTLAQVKALTRQNNGLIRLLLQRFDGTD